MKVLFTRFEIFFRALMPLNTDVALRIDNSLLILKFFLDSSFFTRRARAQILLFALQFDPYFNFRSTKYLVNEGFYNFLNWFDEGAWYPLGRIVGGTVYPGALSLLLSALFVLSPWLSKP